MPRRGLACISLVSAAPLAAIFCRSSRQAVNVAAVSFVAAGCLVANRRDRKAAFNVVTLLGAQPSPPAFAVNLESDFIVLSSEKKFD